MIEEIELSKPQGALYRNAAPYNVVLAGQGGGKSNSIGVTSGLFICKCPKVIGLIAANTYSQLSRATLLETFKVWRRNFGWVKYDAKSSPHGDFVYDREPPSHFKAHGYTFKSNEGNIYLKNGAVIFTASLENYRAIEGVEVGWALLDETADTRPEAVTEVITARLRQNGVYASNTTGVFPYVSKEDNTADLTRPVNPLFIFTKPAKVQWLNDLFLLEKHRDRIIASVYSETDFFYNYDGLRQVICHSVFHNRRFLPDGYIENRMALLAGSGLIGSHFYGDPFAKTGEEFVTEFNAGIHVDATADIGDTYPIHVTIDFNSKPYMSGLICQIVPMTGEWNNRTDWIDLIIAEEYANASPRNSAGHLGEDICNDYGDIAQNGLFIYGDASGNNSVPVKGVKSLFDDFLNHVPSEIGYELRIPRSNPYYKAALGDGTLGRRSFTNAIFAGSKGVRVRINPRCKNFISDLTMCKEDANGRMAKPKNKDGIEERGHHLDAFQYFICHPKSVGYLAKIKDELL